MPTPPLPEGTEPLEWDETTAPDHVHNAIARLPETGDGWEGRGVVVCAGGVRYFPCAWVCIQMLRAQGCNLPVELWHLNPGEMNEAMRRMVEPLGVSCVNAEEVRKSHPARILKGWELKAYALLHSSFREVLLLDADNVPVVDPSFLFETPQFAETGAIFWPDYERLSPRRRIWKLAGVPYRDEPEFESGQIVLDKQRCFRPLSLAMWFNEYSDFWYRHIHGDKETFHIAWRRLDAPYAMPATPINPLEATMCQHDFTGRRIFQHRNLAKWRFAGNRRIEGFLQEERCLHFLEQLEPHWESISGVSIYREETKDPGEAQAAAALTAEIWTYERAGYDRRRMTFLRNGRVGRGAAAMEVFWDIRRIDGELQLDIQADDSLTCRLTLCPDGSWRGRWEKFERMPVVVRLESASPGRAVTAGAANAGGGNPARTQAAVEQLTAARHFYRRKGHDARPMEFLADGVIGEGSARLETQWLIHERQGEILLDIGNEAGLTCRLQLGEGGIWRGYWEIFERMPVEVYPRPEAAEAEGIDVVYTWVDGAASAGDLRAALEAEGAPALPGAATRNRFRSIGELRYSLRSLDAYAPWVRRVFLVTNGDAPPWLDLECPNLQVVNHREIFEDTSALPTFNSHAIELNLHRIPGLSPVFLYFNDDLFLGRLARPEDFLSDGGVQNIFFTDWDIPRGKTDQAHDRAYAFTLRLLDEAYGVKPRKMLAHVPQLYRVDTIEEIRERWKTEIEKTCQRRFRSGEDAVLRILYAYYLLESPAPRRAARKVILPEGGDYFYAPISANRARTTETLSRAAGAKPRFLCLNDEVAGDGDAVEGLFGEVREFLERRFPWPSPFERPG